MKSDNQKLSILEMNRLTVEEFHKSEKMPLIVVLDDVRSLYNVGSVFRTSDAFRVESIYLCGITATPYPVDEAHVVAKEALDKARPCTMKAQQEIHKTALGAEDSVDWRYFSSALEALRSLKEQGYQVLAVEQCHGSTMLNEFRPEEGKKYAVVLGNEVKGVHQEVIDECDGCLEIPQFGTKHSLNVSTTAGIIIWKFVYA